MSYRCTADHTAAIAALEALLQQQGGGGATHVNRYAFNAAIRVCADAGAADEALRLLCQLRQLAAERRAQAQGQGQAGGEAGAAAASSSGSSRNAAPGNSTAGSDGSSSGSGGEDADDELRTDCRSYSAALAAVVAGGRWNRAPQLHRWMAEDGVRPDAPLCTQLLACYAAVGQAGAAQQLLDSMAAGGVPLLCTASSVSRPETHLRNALRGSCPIVGINLPYCTAVPHICCMAACLAAACPHPCCSAMPPLALQVPLPARPTGPTGTLCCWPMPRPGMPAAQPLPIAACAPPASAPTPTLLWRCCGQRSMRSRGWRGCALCALRWCAAACSSTAS